jgi:hypothetical protein
VKEVIMSKVYDILINDDGESTAEACIPRLSKQ